MTEPPRALAPSQRRLQRVPDFTGARLTRFADVFLRHGLPGLLIALAMLCAPSLRALLVGALEAAAAAPLRYASVALTIFLALLVVSVCRDRQLGATQVGWILYLLALSAWEEWVFRLGLPALLGETGIGAMPAVLVSNLLFGALHYFTLRWKARWCVLAFVGGLGFATAMRGGDLAFVVALHWVATWSNTPRPPGGISARLLAVDQTQV